MDTSDTRRSYRVPLELPIVVSGTDCLGAAFLEQTRTLLLSRHGAKILLTRKLVPDQELNLRCLKTGQESDVRVVGQIGGGPEGYHYGVELLDVDVDLWGVEFPPLAEADGAVGRVLLACIRCHTRELAYLDEFEVEVLEVNHYLSRQCKRCRDTTLWKQTALQEGEEAAPPAEPVAVPQPAPPPRTRNERKHVRLDLHVEVCVRAPQYGEEVVVTENVSRGGFCFKSRRHYGVGWVIEVALPYAPGGANIFAPARVVRAEERPAEGVSVHGVAYIPNQQGWTRR